MNADSQETRDQADRISLGRGTWSLQWSLQTLLLLMAVIAAWVTYVHYEREIPRIEQRLKTMQRMARELIVTDPNQIAAVKLQETWYDENRWEIYLPEADYTVRMSTREVDEQGFPSQSEARQLEAGYRRLELIQTKNEDGWSIVLAVDEEPWIEIHESAGWNDSDHSTGGSPFSELTQRDSAKPLVLYRRRYHPRDESGKTIRPTGPCNGLLLWIEPQ